jgi:RNA polymerase sigma-70 factor (ECF subfamily)
MIHRGSMSGTEESGAQAESIEPYLAGLYAKSGAQEFDICFQDFAAILREVSSRYLPQNATHAEAAALHHLLCIEDLVLARACARGNEVAWECFLRQYRQKLYDTAAAIAKQESVARDLADALYAELFGVRQAADGRRISKLASYTGRGSLAGWLRTVLAQDYVNRYRRERHLVSFDQKSEAGEQFEARAAASAAVDSRLEHAVDEALLALPPEQRLLLASWYLDGRTLAQIARMLGVHESTISRRIEKTTVSLRKRIVRGLRERGMSARAAEEAMEVDVRDLFVDVRGRLAQGKSA